MSSRTAAHAALALFVVLCAGASAARAQTVSAATGCPAGNLLAGRRPVAWQDIRGEISLPTDGTGTAEGAVWNAPPALILDTGAATLTYDLQAPITVRALAMQGDANDTYHVWGSLDGKDFRPIGSIEPVEGHGLRTRTLGLGGNGMNLRFLRIGEGVGDGFYSVAELSAFCELPTPFPPPLKIASAPSATVATSWLNFWNDEASARWEMVLAVLGFLFLGWEFKLRKAGRGGAHLRLRKWLLVAFGLISIASYFNFGFFHFRAFVHRWDTFHYYIGSKYFRELSYDRLYECVAVADFEEPMLRRRVEIRKITNLRTNVLETTAEILKQPQTCKQHFSAARWQAFKKDIAYFRNKESPRRWEDTQTDHGYNGTPVWNIAGTVLSNTGSASDAQILILDLIDPAYFFAMVGVVWWAFGWRVTAIGLIAFATNFPSRYYWTGGSFLRWDWLFYLVATVCCLRKQKYLLAGMAIGYATLLRIFPGFLGVGPLLAAVYALVREKRVDRRYLQFFAGAALAACILIPVSIKVAGSADAYKNFIQNTIKHKETPLTNYMGLRTVMAYRPSEAGRMLRSNDYVDPWSKWKDARLQAFKRVKPLYAAAIVAFLLLLGFAVRKAEPWVAAALSATFIAVGVELTCYYYAFIMAVAVLYEVDERVGRILLVCTAFTGFVHWAPLKGMPSWLDEQYTLMSVGTLVAFVVIVWNFGLGPFLAARRVAAATVGGTAAPAAPISASPVDTEESPKKKKRR